MLTFSIGNKHYKFVKPPHLVPGDNWHDAYIDKINRILDSEGTYDNPIAVPSYPIMLLEERSEALFEFGSYWEGSIYYLNKVLYATTLRAQLALIERCLSENGLSDKEQLFLKIWNSHGQLKFLKAFFIREAFRDDKRCGNSWEWYEDENKVPTEVDSSLVWLRDFIAFHKDEGRKYPNPFFGGQNPLHLGLVNLDRR